MIIQLMMWLTCVEAEKNIQNSVCLELQGSTKPLLPQDATVKQVEEMLQQCMDENKPLRVTIEEL